jgi:redox-sensitive bicupin YhaK (pirin superfamily)
MQFGVLRVLNDDLVQPGTGFALHPHKDMEIVSYVVDGALTHKDSMGNEHTLTRGQVQYMSAGTGVFHSEYNNGKDLLRFLQIWILPDNEDYLPNYGEFRFEWNDRNDRWMPIAAHYGNEQSAAPIRIHADINMYACILEAGRHIEFAAGEKRQAYLALIEGDTEVSGASHDGAEPGAIAMKMRDALEITEETVLIHAKDTAHLLVIEMAKG